MAYFAYGCFLIIKQIINIFFLIYNLLIFNNSFLKEYIIISFEIIIIYIFIYDCIEYLKNVWLYFKKYYKPHCKMHDIFYSSIKLKVIYILFFNILKNKILI